MAASSNAKTQYATSTDYDTETLSFLITLAMNITAFSCVIFFFNKIRKIRNDKLLKVKDPGKEEDDIAYNNVQ